VCARARARVKERQREN